MFNKNKRNDAKKGLKNSRFANPASNLKLQTYQTVISRKNNLPIFTPVFNSKTYTNFYRLSAYISIMMNGTSE